MRKISRLVKVFTLLSELDREHNILGDEPRTNVCESVVKSLTTLHHMTFMSALNFHRWPQAFLQDEAGNQVNLYVVPQGNFFGYESFMETNLNPNPSTGVSDSNGEKTEKMSMRALVDCSMYLLSESKIMHLVRTEVREEERQGWLQVHTHYFMVDSAGARAMVHRDQSSLSSARVRTHFTAGFVRNQPRY